MRHEKWREGGRVGEGRRGGREIYVVILAYFNMQVPCF